MFESKTSHGMASGAANGPGLKNSGSSCRTAAARWKTVGTPAVASRRSCSGRERRQVGTHTTCGAPGNDSQVGEHIYNFTLLYGSYNLTGGLEHVLVSHIFGIIIPID